MELKDLQILLEKPDELQKAIIAAKPEFAIKPEDAQKQYDPKQHDITDPAKRQDKPINDENGNVIDTVKVARLPIPMQKRVVRLAATFLCGRPIELTSMPGEQTEKDLLEVVKKTWKDNKLDYKSKKLAKMMMSEMECAELWYTETAEAGFWKGTANDQPKVKFKLRMKMIAPSLGDSLYPVFNASGDLIAFGRGYTIKEGSENVEHFDLYTSSKNYYYAKGQNGFSLLKDEINIVGKIPVIYYSQYAPEWYDVQELTDRFEKSISNHADTNDYHSSPTMVAKNAKVVTMAKKGEQGKFVEIEGEHAELGYVSWDKSPESTKLEQENLEKLIYSLTDTPNISFEQMKSLGTFSGIALKMLFLGAHMKASDHEENFGEPIQRRINYIIAAMGVINVDFEKAITLSIEPKFTYFLPKNESEMIDMLSTATTGGIMSRQTATELNPLIEDAETEVERLKDEANSAAALDNLNNQ